MISHNRKSEHTKNTIGSEGLDSIVFLIINEVFYEKIYYYYCYFSFACTNLGITCSSRYLLICILKGATMSAEFISIFLLAFIVSLVMTLIYRLEKRLNQLALTTIPLSSKSKIILFNYEKLEAISFGWMLGLIAYKYLVGSWLIIPQEWLERQISISIYLAGFFMIFEYVLLFYCRHIDRKQNQ